MEMKLYEVYIKTNENGYIIAVNSSEFLTDTSGWFKIDEGYGDKYHHAQGNYFDKPIYTASGVYQYKYVDGVVRECTADEIAEQEANIPVPEQPSPEDYEARIAALEEELLATKILLGVE
jgi:hypothetical protein